MTDKKPFTEQEQKVMDLLFQAHNEYCILQKQVHAGWDEPADWAFHIRALQARLGMRALVRDYPSEFKSA